MRHAGGRNTSGYSRRGHGVTLGRGFGYGVRPGLTVEVGAVVAHQDEACNAFFYLIFNAKKSRVTNTQRGAYTPPRVAQRQKPSPNHLRQHRHPGQFSHHTEPVCHPNPPKLTLAVETIPLHRGDLKAANGRKNVKSARCREILSANRRRQRPAHAHARADPAQNGQNGGSCAGR